MQKLSIDRGIISFIWRGRYYKIAVTPSGYRLLARENTGYSQAQLDAFFSKFLPTQSYNGITLIRPVLSSGTEMDFHFQEGSSEKLALRQLLDKNFLSLMPEDIQDFVRCYEVATSPAHGDWHARNMMVEDGKPVLIDWGGFQPVFWNRYDEIHYHFCDLIAENGKKLADILMNSSDVIAKLKQKISLDEDDLIAYVLCRSALESDQDRTISKNLYQKRISKYKHRMEIVWRALRT